MDYVDDFSDQPAINSTRAYPTTTLTDPDGYQSKLRYRYDLGTVTLTQDARMLAADASKGILSTYDYVGRLLPVTLEVLL